MKTKIIKEILFIRKKIINIEQITTSIIKMVHYTISRLLNDSSLSKQKNGSKKMIRFKTKI